MGVRSFMQRWVRCGLARLVLIGEPYPQSIGSGRLNSVTSRWRAAGAGYAESGRNATRSRTSVPAPGAVSIANAPSIARTRS